MHHLEELSTEELQDLVDRARILLAQLEVSDRTQAAVLAIQSSLLDEGDAR